MTPGLFRALFGSPQAGRSAPLVLATHNEGKRAELVRLLARWKRLQCVPPSELDPPEEPADTYVDNARHKARHAAMATGHIALADDTGFEVPALPGELGVKTARWVDAKGGDGPGREALRRHFRLDIPPTPHVEARLVCALVVATPSGAWDAAQAVVTGHLAWPPTTAAGLAAIFRADDGHPVEHDGVLEHRRRAFVELTRAR